MARDRSIKLVITAQVDGAKRALKETAEAARKVGEEAEKSSQRSTTASERLVQSARNNSAEWNTAGTAVAGFGAALLVGFGGAVAASANFEKEMSGVKAVTNASASEMDALSQSALEMGAATAFSASEAAVAQAELARAGVSTADILGGALKGSMDLAAAGGLELADAAIISAQAMNLFGLAGDDVSHIADVLASGANKSAADVSDLGQALSQAGTIAAQTGLSLEETVAALSMFADAGVRGSDAGTSLKSMLQRLTPQSKQAQKVFDELGFSAYDAQGNFVGLEELAGRLQASFGHLDTESRAAALGVAFGSDAIRAASILMSGGAEAAREYEEAMNDQGAAARMASTMMDNLAGDIEELGGALETAFIQSGSVANDAMRALVGGATDLVNVYNGLPSGIQTGVTAIAGIGGASAVAVGGMMLLVPKAIETYDAFKRLSEISPRLSDGLGKVGRTVGVGGALVVGIAAAGLALDQLYRNAVTAAPGVDEMTLALLKLRDAADANAVDDLVGNMNIQTNAVIANSGLLGQAAGLLSSNVETMGDAFKRISDPSIGNRIEDLGGSLGFYTSAERSKEAISSLDAALARMAGTSEGAEQASTLLADVLKGTGISTEEAMQHLPGYRDALAAIDVEAREAVASGAELAPVMNEQEAAAEAAAEAMAEWREEIAASSAAFIDSNGAYQAAMEAGKEWAQSVADDTDSAEDSWETYIAEFTGTKDEYLAELRRMAEAQNDWEANLLGLIARGVPMQFVDHLREMGPGAAEEVALLTEMTDKELSEWVELMGQRGDEGMGLFLDMFSDPNAQAVLVAAGEVLGDKALEGLTRKLLSGEMTLQEAIDQYDLDVELGADTAPFEEESAAAMAGVEAKTATPTVDADTKPAADKASAWEFDTNSMRPVPKVDADTKDARAKADRWKFDTNSMRPVPVVDANIFPARLKAAGWRTWADALSASPVVNARTSPATSAVSGLLSWITRQSATISVNARYAGGLNMGGSARTMQSARAAGGVERRPGLAGPQYGRTNMILWGEPETRGEAFISNHPNYRAQNLSYLQTAASWFGKTVVDAYASGHVSQSGARPMVQAGPAFTRIPRSDLDYLIRGVVDGQARAARVQASELNRLNRKR